MGEGLAIAIGQGLDQAGSVIGDPRRNRTAIIGDVFRAAQPVIDVSKCASAGQGSTDQIPIIPVMITQIIGARSEQNTENF